ncbi:HlyD family type I secretion periplasmic adaptor subunit [Rhizobium herbae]|uniref:Membrane fusion protein (MFP) family protein n=1 Tax=Rhizobium herbae TaxID=508661 RepID=A0ABS7HFU5_9HYPH|nr:HlyD family type I secretion periplasmic adaptor subunit [Rhizobium herbae]MBW9066162.1 HlyD family type I secretion periplasmic adaptor subunit [Rhizobium herbae]
MKNDRVEGPASPTIRVTAWFLISLFVIIVAGSYVAKTEIVARGHGKVIPTGRVQLVQPQVDGKIIAILVEEGQSVKRNDVLVRMDATAAESEIARIEAEIERQAQEAAVALSILEPLISKDPTDGGFIEAGKAALRRQKVGVHEEPGTEALVIAVLAALRDQVAETDAQLKRIEGSKSAQLARIEKARSDKEIVARRLTSAETLKEGGAISEVAYLERLREFKAVESDTVIAERQLSELSAEAEAMAKRRISAISAVLSTYRKQVNEAEIALRSSRADLNTAQAHRANLSLKAPANGRVENLSVFTLGGFIEAGATLMSIVPSDGGVEIEAFFDNRDVGFLKTGQKAFVKFDAFPAERFGIVRGRVSSVGADAREDTATRKWVYAVRLNLERPNIRVAARIIDFTPGMTVTVDVITGERRLISYFFEPILKAIQDSFGEQ